MQLHFPKKYFGQYSHDISLIMYLKDISANSSTFICKPCSTCCAVELLPDSIFINYNSSSLCQGLSADIFECQLLPINHQFCIIDNSEGKQITHSEQLCLNIFLYEKCTFIKTFTVADLVN